MINFLLPTNGSVNTRKKFNILIEFGSKGDQQNILNAKYKAFFYIFKG